MQTTLTVLASDVVAGDLVHLPGLTVQPLVAEYVDSRTVAGFRLAVITVWTADLGTMVELAMSYDTEVDVTREATL
jgi:hypothetical protein